MSEVKNIFGGQELPPQIPKPDEKIVEIRIRVKIEVETVQVGK